MLPTGAGKTEIMAKTASDWKADNRDKAVLVLSHLSTLTDQTAERFKLRAPKLTTSILRGKQRPSMLADVVVSTMQTARSAKHIQELKAVMCREIGLLMIDETHMLPTSSYDQIQAHFPGVPLIGYTATPFRQRKIMTNVFDKVSFSISLEELIAQGFLVPPELRAIPAQGQTPTEVIAQTLALYEAQEHGHHAIVYMRTVEDAKTLRNAFESIGVRARAVTGDVTAGARKDIFQSFAKGETKVLCTVDVLTAGFDAPQVETIILPYKIKSPTQYLQRIGRGLRKAPGKTCCRIYAFGDSPTISQKLYEKMQELALKAGSQTGTRETFTDELNYNFWEPESEVYTWTQTVVDAIERMEKLGMSTFAQALDHKTFPPQFMRSIQELLRRLPERRTPLPHGTKPATEAQRALLFEAGFSSDLCQAMNKAEASMMISTLYNHANNAPKQQAAFIVQDGKYKGKHIAELPHAYRTIVKKRFPESPMAALITAWESRQRRA